MASVVNRLIGVSAKVGGDPALEQMLVELAGPRSQIPRGQPSFGVLAEGHRTCMGVDELAEVLACLLLASPAFGIASSAEGLGPDPVTDSKSNVVARPLPRRWCDG